MPYSLIHGTFIVLTATKVVVQVVCPGCILDRVNAREERLFDMQSKWILRVLLSLIMIGLANRYEMPTAHAEGVETVGNKPLNGANYESWPSIMPLVNHRNRIYHSWVNGHENFYYSGDVNDIAKAIELFSKVGIEIHEVVFRPGPGTTSSLMGDKKFNADWHLQIMGGISQVLFRSDDAAKIWPKHPRLTVFVNEATELQKIKIPAEVTVVGIEALKQRIIPVLRTSTDQTTRGWGTGVLAQLDPNDKEILKVVYEMLDDEVDWVKLNAAGAIGSFGVLAKPLQTDLTSLMNETENDQLKAALGAAIEKIETVQPNREVVESHRKMLARIDAYLKMPPYVD